MHYPKLPLLLHPCSGHYTSKFKVCPALSRSKSFTAVYTTTWMSSFLILCSVWCRVCLCFKWSLDVFMWYN